MKKMKKLYRSRTDRMICGVCGGISQYFEIDPTLLRILYVILWIFTGFLPLLIVYLISVLVIPLNPKEVVSKNYSKFFRSKKNRKIAGICGGVAEMINIDATIVRLFTLFLCLITGIVPILITYLIGWALIPERP